MTNSLVVSNWKSSNTKNWYTALAKAAASVDLARLVFVGDSITASLNGSPQLFSFPTFCEKAIEARTQIPLNDSASPAGNGTTQDGRWVETGAWIAAVPCIRSTTVGAGANTLYTSLRAGTVVEILYPNIVGAIFNYSIDGGAAVLITPAGGSPLWLRETVTGLANTTHNVRITPTTTTATYAVQVQVRQTFGLTVMNWGYAGMTSTNLGSAANFTYLNITLQSQPHLVVINIGTNDIGNGVSIGNYINNLIVAVATFRAANSDVVFMTVPTSGYSVVANVMERYWDAMRNLATTLNVPIIELSDYFGDQWLNSDDLADASNLHPSNSANALVGQLLADVLIP